MIKITLTVFEDPKIMLHSLSCEMANTNDYTFTKTRPSFEKRYNGCTLKKPGEYLSGQNNSRKLDITRLKKVLRSIENLKICKNM